MCIQRNSNIFFFESTCFVDRTWFLTVLLFKWSSSLHAFQNSLTLDTTRFSLGNSFTLCVGVTLFGSEPMDDDCVDERLRLSLRPRLLRTLHFLFSADGLWFCPPRGVISVPSVSLGNLTSLGVSPWAKCCPPYEVSPKVSSVPDLSPYSIMSPVESVSPKFQASPTCPWTILCPPLEVSPKFQAPPTCPCVILGPRVVPHVC